MLCFVVVQYIVATEIGLDMVLEMAQNDELVNQYFIKHGLDWIPEWMANTHHSKYKFDTTPANYFMHKPIAAGGSEPPRREATKNSAERTARKVLRHSIRQRLRTVGSDGSEYRGTHGVGWKEGKDDPRAIIGKRVALRWFRKRKPRWYKAYIRRYFEETTKHEVLYDDGDLKTYDLRVTDIKFIA